MTSIGVDLNETLEGLPDPALVLDDGGVVLAANVLLGTLLGTAREGIVGARYDTLFDGNAPCATGASPDVTPVETTSPPSNARPHVGRMKHSTPGVLLEVECFASRLSITGGGAVRLIVFKAPQRPFTGRDPAESVARVVFENAPLGIFHGDAAGVLTACNQTFTRLMGSSEAQLVGLHTLSLANPEIVARIRAALAGDVAQYIGEYVSVTGKKKIFVNALFAPVFGEHGELVGLIGLVQDETERVNAERFVARAEKMGSLVALAAGTVHEIQNPLAFTMTSLDLAMRLVGDSTRPDRAEALSTALAHAREGAARVAGIARDLKKFARSDDEARTSVDVRDALDEAIRYVKPQIEARAVLQLDARQAPKVHASRQRLVQVFVNLLVNAVEALPEGARESNVVRVSLRGDAAGNARIAVEDSGTGIPKEVATRLFEPFATSKSAGMGLGLSICHGIVTALGGEIQYEARLPRGTRFVVTLPPSPDETRAAAASAETRAPQGRPRILVVDDEERLAATIRLALLPSYDVDVCTNGTDALARMREREFDVVLCDVFLPDRSAPEIFDEVTHTAPHLAPRFVFLTGGAFTENARAFLQNVPNPRLEKPFELERLESVIADQLRLTGAEAPP